MGRLRRFKELEVRKRFALILGGKMEPENFEVTDWRVHVSLLGQMRQKMKGLPATT